MRSRNGRRRLLTRVRVALLWHMRQPAYRDPLDGAVVLPWVEVERHRLAAPLRICLEPARA